MESKGFEPLSVSTRRARNSLLFASTALLSTALFNLKVTQLDISSVQMDFDDGLVDWILLFVAFYFFVIFSAYIYDDWLNYEKPNTQTKSKSSARQEIARRSKEIPLLVQAADDLVHWRRLSEVNRRNVTKNRPLLPIRKGSEKPQVFERSLENIRKIRHNIPMRNDKIKNLQLELYRRIERANKIIVQNNEIVDDDQLFSISGIVRFFAIDAVFPYLYFATSLYVWYQLKGFQLSTEPLERILMTLSS